MYYLSKDLKPNEFFLGFHTIKNFLSDSEIKEINEYASKLQTKKAATHNREEYFDFLEYDQSDRTDQYRNSNITWLHPKNKVINDLYKKIINIVIERNEEIFNFNLSEIETLQYTVYDNNQFYKKHLDISSQLFVGGVHRKLSFSIQLSDPNEYEGGELHLYRQDNPEVAEKDKGSITFFPSFMLHEVTPVSRGKRISLVGWVNGPKFV